MLKTRVLTSRFLFRVQAELNPGWGRRVVLNQHGPAEQSTTRREVQSSYLSPEVTSVSAKYDFNGEAQMPPWQSPSIHN